MCLLITELRFTMVTQRTSHLLYNTSGIFHCILISRFSYVENLLQFNLADFHEVLIFYADTLW